MAADVAHAQLREWVAREAVAEGGAAISNEVGTNPSNALRRAPRSAAICRPASVVARTSYGTSACAAPS